MEDALFYPAEHSKRTAGKKALRRTETGSSAQGGIESMKNIFQIPGNLPKTTNLGLEGLTSRELEVLQLVAYGLLNKQIADKLSISMHTVISHRKNITRKLQIKTVAGLTIYALLNGLISSKNIS
jgi:DNA-binding NarL/FixJ family response regulator